MEIALDLTNPLPPSVGALSRWTAEPVKHIWLPASSFISNGKGYPVLSKACQAFLKGMTKVNLSPSPYVTAIDKIAIPNLHLSRHSNY
jgi:protein arginine N-methyltransferase 5